MDVKSHFKEIVENAAKSRGIKLFGSHISKIWDMERRLDSKKVQASEALNLLGELSYKFDRKAYEEVKGKLNSRGYH